MRQELRIDVVGVLRLCGSGDETGGGSRYTRGELLQAVTRGMAVGWASRFFPAVHI